MRNIIIATLCLTALTTLQAQEAASKTIPVTKEIRISSAPLSRSVANETSAAIDRGTAWLLANQEQDGSWAGTHDSDRLYATSLSLIALGNNYASDTISNSVKKAMGWIKENKKIQEKVLKTNLNNRYAILAWNNCAYNMHELANIGFEQSFKMLTDHLTLIYKDYDFKNPETKDKLIKQTDKNGILSLKGIKDDPELAWFIANTINREFGGTLSITDKDGNTQIVDWRGDLANHRTTTQHSDSKGNGHWQTPSRTALALLLLNEL